MSLKTFYIVWKRKIISIKLKLIMNTVLLASKHQDGGMYKTPAYSGYPFLMLPDPYLSNSSVSPSVSPPLYKFPCWLFFIPPSVCFSRWCLTAGILRKDELSNFLCKCFFLGVRPNTKHIFSEGLKSNLLQDCKWLVFTVEAEKQICCVLGDLVIVLCFVLYVWKKTKLSLVTVVNYAGATKVWVLKKI